MRVLHTVLLLADVLHALLQRGQVLHMFLSSIVVLVADFVLAQLFDLVESLRFLAVHAALLDINHSLESLSLFCKLLARHKLLVQPCNSTLRSLLRAVLFLRRNMWFGCHSAVETWLYVD